LFPDATTLRLAACHVDTTAAQLTLLVRSTQTRVPCPLCAIPARRIHSHYERTLADLPWAEYRVLRDARAVLFTCEEECRLARDSFWLYRCNEVVVNYGTSRPKGDPDAQRREFFLHYPELQGKKLVLFMGRVHPKKGCDLLIEAFAKVLGPRPEWHLVIAGPDQVGWQKNLNDRAVHLGMVSRVTWAGMVNGAMKWGMLRAAEVFLLPSHQENFGIAVAEALAAGAPALISNKVNIWREILADGAGMVFIVTCAETAVAVTAREARMRVSRMRNPFRGILPCVKLPAVPRRFLDKEPYLRLSLAKSVDGGMSEHT